MSKILIASGVLSFTHPIEIYAIVQGQLSADMANFTCQENDLGGLLIRQFEFVVA